MIVVLQSFWETQPWLCSCTTFWFGIWSVSNLNTKQICTYIFFCEDWETSQKLCGGIMWLLCLICSCVMYRTTCDYVSATAFKKCYSENNIPVYNCKCMHRWTFGHLKNWQLGIGVYLHGQKYLSLQCSYYHSVTLLNWGNNILICILGKIAEMLKEINKICILLWIWLHQLMLFIGMNWTRYTVGQTDIQLR